MPNPVKGLRHVQDMAEVWLVGFMFCASWTFCQKNKVWLIALCPLLKPYCSLGRKSLKYRWYCKDKCLHEFANKGGQSNGSKVLREASMFTLL
ncbi:hypothetical protein TNCT_478011 [Trichonephila clavata]|uniref:Uncharacterized protein n=1 Tax=Trichonephila clavata TaxID=2740835 RepID=A0A8X6JTT8_TRICU|nr:hypothetical protein TNCT_478011 [Trichonephila clavata]